MKVLSLFDGISCGMVAIEQLNIPIEEYAAYEIDENAIKVSEFNYPFIKHYGDVFNATYNEGDYDLLIGGSPCTHWSIAQTKNRETFASGIGWDLFAQYLRALQEVKPKYFLYENNYSMSKEIKNVITNVLGVQPIYINSSICSGQNRKRLYWTNIPQFNYPILDIKLSDCIDWSTHNFRDCGQWVYKKWGDKLKIDTLKTINSIKSHTLTTSGSHPMNYYLNEEKTKYCNLTIEDWEKLQTLPIGYVDNVQISKQAKYKCIGNGWTINVIVLLLRGLVK